MQATRKLTRFRLAWLESSTALASLTLSLAVALVTGCAPPAPNTSTLLSPPQMSSAPLESDAVLNRIALGSCYVPQFEESAIWNTIRRADPDAFLFLGDNVYQSEEKSEMHLFELREAYAALSRDEPFAALRREVPLLPTWDDHDYGLNDAGGEWPIKRYSEALFENVWAVAPDDDRRKRDGVYFARLVGPQGQRVHLIVLDTRFFRSKLPPKRDGRYSVDDSATKTILGEEQWTWLAREFERPTDLRIVASSFQVLSEGRRGESWGQLPLQRRRLLEMARAASPSTTVVFVSGDRHMGALYSSESEGDSLWELTASSLNFPMSEQTQTTWAEPDDRRVGDLYFGANYGMVVVDWVRRRVALELRNEFGFTVRRKVLPLSH